MAELIRDHIALEGIELYCDQTGIRGDDFIPIEPCDFAGHIFAVDGSNRPICGWSVGSVNLIRAGYAVYRGRTWERTVITYDDIFLADQEICASQFDPYLDQLFGLEGIDLREKDLERLSTYFRELQEYIALYDAISHASAEDLVLYDGSFDVFEPLRGVLHRILLAAEERGVVLLGISKSSALSWGSGIALPFVQHTAIAGSLLRPGVPWYLSLEGKRLKDGPAGRAGGTYIVRLDGRSWHAFRLDVPIVSGIGSILGRLAACSCSSECPGYPHALFRAHRDIRITDQEGDLLRMKLLDRLGEMGLSSRQIMMLMQDYHDVLEMRF